MKNNRSGYTISELMVVILILCFIVVVVGGGITVAKNTYQKITLKAESQALMSTTITKVSDELRYAGNVVKSDDGKYTFESFSKGCRMYFDNGDGSAGQVGIIIQPVTSSLDKTGLKPTQLLTEKAMTSNLLPSINISYSESTGIFDVAIAISHDGEEITSQSIKIKAING